MKKSSTPLPIEDDFHTLSSIACIEKMQSNPQGISASSAKERLIKYGKNALPIKKQAPLILRFLAQFSDAMVMVLIAAAFIAAAIAISQKELGELIDSGVILFIVIVNAIIGLVQQDKANNAMEALKNLSKPFAKVKRDGVIQKISSENIVIGDVIILEAGDSVPADLRLTSCVNLKIEEAALTGESVASEKSTSKINAQTTPLGDRKNMAYSTSTVVYGRGEGVVVGTGINTQVGKIATMLDTKDKSGTPLQRQLSKTAKILSIIVLAIAVVIFIASLINSQTVIHSFMTSVAIAVAAIPEGLPAVVTIVLAIGVRIMSTKKAIIRNMPSVEVLGSTQVICSDKTGTLTQNKMTVTNCYTFPNDFSATVKPNSHTKMILAQGMALCNDTQINDNTLIGDPTETALTAYALTHNIDFYTNLKRINEIPFDSERKLMSVLVTDGVNTTSYTKGAFDMLINKCTHIAIDTAEQSELIANGLKLNYRPITQLDIDTLKTTCENYAKQALRVLALGTTPNTTMEKDLIFVGLVAMIDPPREEVKPAIEECKSAKIKTVMITGDHVVTAMAIAKEIGIDGKVIDGLTLDTLDETELKNTIMDYGVFARVSPANKVRIVQAFKSNDKITAMTGDGVNDAPALKTADIGIGMGITGTDVAKSASDMVLADDNFATIVAAVKEGRKVFSNIKKAIRFLLSANIAEVLCLFIVTVFFRMTFLTPVMILWVNLVTDSLPALALGLEKAENDIMQKPPLRHSNLLKGKMGSQIFSQGIAQSILVLTSFFVGLYLVTPHSHTIAMTMAFATLCIVQLLHAYNCRSEDSSLFSKNPLSNRTLNLSFIIGVLLTLSVIYITPIANIFGLTNLNIYAILSSITLSILIIPIVEIFKTISNK